MDPRQLSYFVRTARCEHMGTAAAELRISESTLSRSISRLERAYGIALFDRVGRGIRLNAFGRILLASVEDAFAALESGERELRALARSGSARVGLGFTASLGARAVPQLLGHVAAAHRGRMPQIALVEDSAQALRTQLLDGELDLTLGTKRFEDPAVDWQPLWEEGLVAIVPAGHPAAARPNADFPDIAGDQILAFRASETTRRAFADMARATGVAPNVVFACDDIATLTGLVASGFGTAVVPDSLALPDAAVVRVPLRSAPRRVIGIAAAKARPLSPAAAGVRDAIVRVRAGERRRAGVS